MPLEDDPLSCISKARVKERIRYYFGDQLIPEASSFKYLGIITRSDLNWADHVNYILRKVWKALHFTTLILKKGNNNTKPLAYTALLRPMLEYRAVCWDPYKEGQVSALNRFQNRAAKFSNNLSRDDHNKKITTRKERTNVGKYSFVHRTTKC